MNSELTEFREELIKEDKYSEYYSSDTEKQFMTEVSISKESVFRTDFSILKIIHSESFSSKLLKARLFILQINNKIINAAEATKERKIKYAISLL